MLFFLLLKDQQLSSTKPHLLFLNETQASEATNNSPFSILPYFSYPQFCSKAGRCIYVHHDLTCFLVPAHSVFIFSLKSPPLEISIFTTSFDFPLCTNHPGVLAFNFVILQELEQMVQHPTHTPDHLGDQPFLILTLFLSLPELLS